MRWRRARRTAYYQRQGERVLARMDATTAARCAAIKACHDGPDAMAALLDDLGKRIAVERARHGFPEPAPRWPRNVDQYRSTLLAMGPVSFWPMDGGIVGDHMWWHDDGTPEAYVPHKAAP